MASGIQGHWLRSGRRPCRQQVLKTPVSPALGLQKKPGKRSTNGDCVECGVDIQNRSQPLLELDMDSLNGETFHLPELCKGSDPFRPRITRMLYRPSRVATFLGKVADLRRIFRWLVPRSAQHRTRDWRTSTGGHRVRARSKTTRHL